MGYVGVLKDWLVRAVAAALREDDPHLSLARVQAHALSNAQCERIILRLFREREPITYVSDWFALHDAVLQVRPYQQPHMPIVVASVRSPAGPALASKHGAAVLSMSVPRETEARADINYLWSVAEEAAAEHGQTVRREEWRLVLPVHLAESRDEAINDLRLGAGRFNREYLAETLGRPLEFDGPVEQILDHLVETGEWIVGTPDDCIETIKRLNERSGGFGGFLVGFTQDLAPRDKVLRSYELMAHQEQEDCTREIIHTLCLSTLARYRLLYQGSRKE